MPDLQPIELKTDGGIVKFTLTPPDTSPQVRDALINNTTFPDDAFTGGKMIPLGAIGVVADSDEFKLGEIKFKVKGGLLAGFGVFRSAEELFKTLKKEGLDEPMVKKINFPDLDRKNLFALRWGYSVGVNAAGKIPNVAFGVGVNFGAGADAERLYAVLRSFDRDEKAFDAISETIKGWKMPGQITSPKKLQPGTWLISEVNGKLDLSLGIEYGYEYSWSREKIEIGGLSGDLALKIQAGIAAKFGFAASGRYALVLARESDAEKLRLQVFKLKQNGWSFAFDAAISGEIKQEILPKDLYEFVKGVFNLNGLQALKDIEKWLDTKTDLAKLISDKFVDDVKKLVEKITGVTPKNIDEALAKLKEPIEKWRALPHEIATVIYDLLKKISPEELAKLRAFVEKVADLSKTGAAEEELKEFIGGHLGDVAFFETPIGKWLTAAAEEGILSLIANLKIKAERDKLNELANQTKAVLNGKKVEDALKELQKWIEEKLNLDKIINLASEADFEALDDWLKQRVSEFLGKLPGETIVFKELEQIKEVINKFLDKNALSDFYDKAIKALTDKYQAELHYTFQKTTEQAALVDLTFDFEENAANAERLLGLALRGDFKEVLGGRTRIEGVRINQAALTHEIKRQAHLEVGFPIVGDKLLDHFNKSSATVEQDNGRLWVFSLDAKDVVKKKTRISTLSVAVKLTDDLGVRVFGKTGNKYSYQLRFVKQNADGTALRKRLEEVAGKYFPAEFPNTMERNFNKYLGELDRALDEKGIKGADNFGNVLADFSLALPGEVLTAWKNAPSNKKSEVYFSISETVQRRLRDWIPLVYIHDLEQYGNAFSIYPLLVYQAMPLIDKIQRVGNQIEPKQRGGVYEWDYQDSQILDWVINNNCKQNLPALLARIRQVISARPDIDQSGYRDGQIGGIIKVVKKNKAQRQWLISLVQREKTIIEGVMQTAKEFNKFLKAEKYTEAVKKLADFGAEVTDTFNEDVGGIYSGENLRPLGSLLLLEIAGLLDPSLVSGVKPTAMLELIVVKPQAKFALAEFLNNKRPEPDDIALQQTIVNV